MKTRRILLKSPNFKRTFKPPVIGASYDKEYSGEDDES